MPGPHDSAADPAAWLASLNRYAVDARYPGFWEPIEREEAEGAVAAAREVMVVGRRALSADAT